MKEKVILIKMIQFLMNFIINNKELFLNDYFINVCSSIMGRIKNIFYKYNIFTIKRKKYIQIFKSVIFYNFLIYFF